MPALDILDEDGKLSAIFAGPQVLAVSFYPDDEAKREEMLAVFAAELMLVAPEADRKLELLAPFIPALVRALPPPQIWHQASRHGGNSWMAGEILLFLLSSTIHHPELQVTPTKAIHSLAGLMRGAPTFGGDPVSVGIRRFWQSWSRFKSVAHFHAVRQILWQHATDAAVALQKMADLTAERLVEYLALARALSAEAFKYGILVPSETWTIPDSLELPPAQIGSPPLPEVALAALAAYQPEHSREP